MQELALKQQQISILRNEPVTEKVTLKVDEQLSQASYSPEIIGVIIVCIMIAAFGACIFCTYKKKDDESGTIGIIDVMEDESSEN